MKIVKVEAFKLALPMKVTFKTSFGTVKNKQTVIVKLTSSEGLEGYGEAPALSNPFYLYETTDTCMLAIKNYIAPNIIEKEIKTAKSLMKLISPIRGHNFAKTGVETSFWHLLSQESNKPLSKLLGGTKTKIPVGESIGIKQSKKELISAVSHSLEIGFKRVKLKIQPGWDYNIVKLIKNTFGNIDLMVDANSAYTLKNVPLFKKLDKFNLTMIEQPLAHDDIIDHATLQKEIKTPICLDESITSAEDARKAIEIKACKIINIKPARVGGILESKKIHDYCKLKNVPVWCGGMLETGIGRAFNLAVASLPNFKFPADMSPPTEFYKEDLVEPTLKLEKNGFINVSSNPGLGYNVLISRINKYTLEKIAVK